jgi:hypothetical protein
MTVLLGFSTVASIVVPINGVNFSNLGNENGKPEVRWFSQILLKNIELLLENNSLLHLPASLSFYNHSIISTI